MINYLESGVGSESEHEGSGSKGEEDSDGENTPSPPSMVTTLTNSHNGQSSCNTKVRYSCIFCISLKYLFRHLCNVYLYYLNNF